MSAEISSIIQSRDVKFLVHFTRSSNLASILDLGLVPRANLAKKVEAYSVNDQCRWDGRTKYNCTSISFPNSQMFYSYMLADPSVKWPILLLRPQVMREKELLFCRHNAADARISSEPSANLRSADAFRGMFLEIDGCAARLDQGLKPCDPTDVQAEVLISGTIEPKYIGGVVFPDAATAEAFKHKLGNRRSFVNGRDGLYGNRMYYRKYGAGR